MPRWRWYGKNVYYNDFVNSWGFEANGTQDYAVKSYDDIYYEWKYWWRNISMRGGVPSLAKTAAPGATVQPQAEQVTSDYAPLMGF